MAKVKAVIKLLGPDDIEHSTPVSQSIREAEFEYDSGIPEMPLEGVHAKALCLALKWIEKKGGGLYYGVIVERILVQHYPR